MTASRYVLLDDSLTPGGRSLLYTEPEEIVSASSPGEVGTALDAVSAGLARGLHAAGFFSYELGYCLEPKLSGLLPAKRSVPLFWIGLFRAPQPRDDAGTRAWLEAQGAFERAKISDLRLSWSRDQYRNAFNKVEDYIAAGDVYQINLTFPLNGMLDGDPLGLYRVLRKRQPVAHGGVVALGPEIILSLSPELFFELERGVVRSRPMKGTARRGLGPHEDMMIARDLKEDEKQRAENLMIVDLLRNDIGRLSRIGTVRVPQLFTVETYNTLHQMTSTVEGELAGALSIREILAGLFPCGSVTGAPKIRAMEIIRELEATPRGVYCGAIGRIGADGSMRFNVAIRTLTVLPDNRFLLNVGSGLVADSRADTEYEECLLKARFLNDSIGVSA
jgi:aminodeoxychorismate synthase component I